MKVGRLIELLQQVDSEARVWGYEGEDVGISIMNDDRKFWFIRAHEGNWDGDHEEYTEGFSHSTPDGAMDLVDRGNGC